MIEGFQTLGDIGEFGFISRLRERVHSGEGVLLGIGDDAALVQSDATTLASADMLVEGVHFDLTFCSPSDVGFKSLAVNVSDIAAMGGRARYALVCVGAPSEMTTHALEELYAGMLEAARRFDVSIIGGDLTGSPNLSIAVTILGDPSDRVITRSGAQAGDCLCVTGSLGAAACGLALARLLPYDVQAAALSERFGSLLDWYRRPVARIDAGATLATFAHAMIDVSDGLARDASHLAEESGLGLDVDARLVPLAGGVIETAELLGADPSIIAAGGGDDYELCIACEESHFEELQSMIAPLELTKVGAFSSNSSQRLLHTSTESIPLDQIGWEHFT
ncbi:MAG: thiamine-phosphate kinase [Actinomycetota bacterium]